MEVVLLSQIPKKQNFKDLFTQTVHKQAPLHRLAPFMDDIVVTKEGVTKLLKGLNPSKLEKVQNRAARFVTRNYTFEEGSMTGILEQLKWESLKKRRTDNRHTCILLFKGLKGKAR